MAVKSGKAVGEYGQIMGKIASLITMVSNRLKAIIG